MNIQSFTVGTPVQKITIRQPSKLGLPRVDISKIPTPLFHAEDWVLKLASIVFEEAQKGHSIANIISEDSKLSHEGKIDRISKEMFKIRKHFSERVQSYMPELTGEIRQIEEHVRTDFAKKRKELATDPFLLSETRAWLKSLDPQERNKVLREASQGKRPHSDLLMEAASAGPPELINMRSTDPNFTTSRDTWLERKFPTHVAALKNKENAIQLAQQSDAWLAGYLASAVDDFSYRSAFEEMERGRLAANAKDSS